MTVKSNCELDVRIKSTDDIQTCLRYNEEFVGCKGYFFDDLVKATDLSESAYGTLLKVDNTDHVTDLCFKAELKNGNRSFFRFFIPEKLLKPVKKKYRPFSLAEWIDKHGIGDVVHYRSKSEGIALHHMYVGYAYGIGKDINEDAILNNPVFEQEFNPLELITGDGKVYLVDDDPDERFLVTKSCQKRQAIHDVLTLLDEHSVPTNDIRAFLRGYLAGSYDGENE